MAQVTDPNELRILVDGLTKQLQDRISPTNSQADEKDVAKAERILELVRELAKK